ncbi:MAG: hypothetical protein AB8B49_05570 [Nitratireductor sp.]
MDSSLNGLQTYLKDEQSPLYQHGIVGSIVSEYIKRLFGSFESWQHRMSMADTFKISQSESGFPLFQNVLEVQNDTEEAKARLGAIDDEDTIRAKMVDYILSAKKFPKDLQKQMAERRYLETLIDGSHFSPLVLPKTVRVSVNPKTGRPYYVVHWGYYDGVANLPMVYMAVIEDSSPNMVKTLLGKDNKINKNIDIPLPVDGLLNPQIANAFDVFCEKNSAYSLTLSTIGTSLDTDFEHLHPKQLRRFVLGPFYHADITVHGKTVDKILQKVKREENQWLLTWTMQEILSVNEKPAKWGLWGGDPAREEFYINTDDLDCARQGVSSFERHALVPHEAYQAIFASGEADDIFKGYKRHVISGNQVLRDM